MFWNKKEGDKLLPDLPPLKLPEHPDFDSSSSSYSIEESESSNFSEPPHTLPSMDNQSDIKYASSLDESPDESIIHDDIMQSNPPAFQTSFAPAQPHIAESKSSIFVKLDRFQSAKKSLILLEQKINDMESLLKKIRETRLREEQELVAWEKEVSMVKPRIEEISKNLFDKIV